MLAGLLVIGVQNALVLLDLRRYVAQQGHGVALRLNGLVDESPLEQRIHDLPPRRIVRQSDVLPAYQRVKFRQGAFLIQARLVFVRKFVIRETDGALHDTGHILRGSRRVQRSAEQRQEVGQKGPVCRQRLPTPQGGIKGIDGIFIRHAQAVVRRQMLLPFRQALPQQGYQPRTGRANINDGYPRQPRQPGLRDKGEIHGVEKHGLAAAHWRDTNVNPRRLLRGIGGVGKDLAILCSQQKRTGFPRRCRAQGQHADSVFQRSHRVRRRAGRHERGDGGRHPQERVAKGLCHITCSPALQGFGKLRHAPPQSGMGHGKLLLTDAHP